MESRWQDADANSQVAQRGPDCNEDLALRVYTSRLIGADPDLVLHGGGNTSVKTRVRDLLGEEREVICVKGSGWDLASIEAPGLPALDLPALRRLRELETLSDEEMVNQLRTRLLDASAPTPSVETLLHAFLPDKFVDHTHADAALVFGNRPEGARELEDLFGGRVGVLPWIMPGFPLGKQVARYRDENPDSIGLVLHMHGVFSWGEHARESYERMIEIVDRIEGAIRERLEGRKVFPEAGGRPLEDELRAAAVDSALALRRFTAASSGDALDPLRPMILEWRPSDEALQAAEAPPALFRKGPLTPDHAIRTKGWYVLTEREEEAMAVAVAGFTSDYVDYFTRSCAGRDPLPRMLDPFPRVVLVKGAGLFAFGRTKRDARICADIAEHTIRGKLRSAALSDYAALGDEELFEMEYWSLEQAKLGRAKEPPLARKIALVTGAAGAIGFATARLLLERGAHVVLCDLPGEALDRAVEELSGLHSPDRVLGVPMDVSDEQAVERAFHDSVLAFGGLDILVANAGIAHTGSLDALALEDWERVLRVNETGTFLCFREAARLMKWQRLGGRLILNASKNVPSPGADFAAYSASKAGAVQVARVAALELAPHGITVNLVHADGVFADEESGRSSGLWDLVGPERMASRGQSPEELRAHYRDRNLLEVAVTAKHVAEAIAFFAEGRTPTTGAALTVDGGHKETFYR